MGTLTTSVGLISGLPINDLVDQLIAVQARPIVLLQNRIDQTNAVLTAYLDLAARLLSLKNVAARLKQTDLFRAATAASSNADVIFATASTGAALGSYTFTVRNLASAHQVISNGFASSAEPLLSAGTITIERDEARLDRGTPLASLNGGAGVRTGRIRVTDRSGASAEIDLTAAQTVSDVLSAINGQTAASVLAFVEGDRIVIQDTSSGAGTLTVEDLGGGFAALDLGLRATSGTGRLEGADLVRLTTGTSLNALNDGNGVRIHGVSDDLRITLSDGSSFDVTFSSRIDASTPLAALNGGAGVPAGRISITNRAGQTAEIDLTAAGTLGDVTSSIQAAGLNVTATLVGSHILLTDNSGGAGTLTVSEVDNGGTAAALGLDVAAVNNTVTGRDIYRVAALGDVLRAINLDIDNGGRLVAEIAPDGDHIRLIDQTAGGGTLSVTALNGSNAAEDLGLTAAASGTTHTSNRLLAGLNSVLLRTLNGGGGVGTGVIELTDRGGASTIVDLSAAATLDDVVLAINAAGVGISARVNGSGLGIELVDITGAAGNLRVADVSGTLAADLRIAVDAAVASVDSGNLQRQYASVNTRLDRFRGGVPFVRGNFRVTDSSGASAVVDLTQGNEITLGDVINEINSRGLGIVASINATGDGLLLTDTAGGTGRLRVSEEGGNTARSLGILGEAAAGQTTLDGSLEKRITVTTSDTLTSLQTKIRDSGAPVNTAIINDGSPAAPFRLNLTSAFTGAAGRLVIDAGQTGLGFTTLIEGRDATVLFGPPDSATPLVLTSANNTVVDAIPGVTLNLRGVSAAPVTISVSEDVEQAVGALHEFVDGFNAIVSRIADLTKFNPETEVRGLLLGDATVERVRSRLYRIVNQTAAGIDGPYTRLSSLGVRVASGAQLSFDEQRFREALAADPAAVERLFTTAETGLGTLIDEQLNQLTDSTDGLLTRRSESLSTSVEALSARKTHLEELLERQRLRLLERFQAAERALAQLQSQQSALGALAGFVSK